MEMVTTETGDQMEPHPTAHYSGLPHPASSALGRPRHEDATTHEPLEGDAIEDFVLLHRDIPGSCAMENLVGDLVGNGCLLRPKKQQQQQQQQQEFMSMLMIDRMGFPKLLGVE